jgi:hypothetical protein
LTQGQNYFKNDDVSSLAGQGREISNQLLNELRNLKKYLI